MVASHARNVRLLCVLETQDSGQTFGLVVVLLIVISEWYSCPGTRSYSSTENDKECVACDLLIVDGRPLL